MGNRGIDELYHYIDSVVLGSRLGPRYEKEHRHGDDPLVKKLWLTWRSVTSLRG